MNTELYNNMITKTFRDDAIRSVVMIDDDFMPYEMLVSQLNSPTITSAQRSGTARAASLHKFFQRDLKMICDIDNGTEHLDINKIRKSDLIILDYHLENGSPDKSIKLINDLRNNSHMNLVVVYTQETNLSEVWLKIVGRLKGSTSIESIFENEDTAYDLWSEQTDHSSKIPDAWLEKITEEALTNYLLTGKPSNTVTDFFGKEYRNSGKVICKALCERQIRAISGPSISNLDIPIIGENNDVKWIQTGNVFVVLHNKSNGTNESELLWQALSNGLHHWKPSYYRLLISQIQNLLENKSVSFEATLESDLECQTAWLYKIISTSDFDRRQSTVALLLERLIDELKSKILHNVELSETINSAFDVLVGISKAELDGNTEIKIAELEKNRIANSSRDATSNLVNEAERNEKYSIAAMRMLMKMVVDSLITTPLANPEALAVVDPNKSVFENVDPDLASLDIHQRMLAHAKTIIETDIAATKNSNELFSKLKTQSKMADRQQQKLDQSILDEKFSNISFAAKHVGLVVGDKLALESDILHALNSDLCLRPFTGGYITSGTVLKDRDDDNKWFLCVAPACETVPGQHTGGNLTNRLKPHRFMKLIILIEQNKGDVLKTAEESRHIFVFSGTRRAFAVQSGDSHQPIIDFALVHNHDCSQGLKIEENGVNVSFLGLDMGKKLTPHDAILIPVAQLRDSYAARFQTVASHHSGRVGVDYVNSMI